MEIKNTVSTMLDRILTDKISEPVTRHSIDVRDKPVADFLNKQMHIATDLCGDIDPADIDEYIKLETGLLSCISYIFNPR